MSGRDIDEENRVSSSLELLFDLTFVVAVAQIAVQLARTITAGTALTDGVGPYLMVFFAIWWAWLNFTWFASAYDTDDLPYRLATMVQMGGVLVLAAGVQSAFDKQQYLGITLGYFIMRVGLVGQWVRAGIENPDGRRTAFRYAGAITIVQLGWIARLLLPPELGALSFIVLALADVSVPLWAERTGLTPWHPHHIAERYGLFTIILLGESVSAVTIAVQKALDLSGVSVSLVVVALGGLVLLFGLWWLYFLEPAGDGLASHRSRSFLWGYGHYALFAAIAAIGAALEVAVEAGTSGNGTPEAGAVEAGTIEAGTHAAISPPIVGYALAIPVALFFVLLYLLHAAIEEQVATRPLALAVAAATVLLVPLGAPFYGVPMTIVLIALVTSALTATSIVDNVRRAARGAQ
ncbi:low temperature requirement protein A [Glaciihabitans sp. INWT7]|nr:low temperature requirement protein A [Glaciihabitans sp. INWT7]